MFRPPKIGWIGYDLGAASVKTAQVVRAGNGYRIRTAAMAPRRDRWTSETFAGAKPPSSLNEMQAAASICDRLAGSAAAAVMPMALCDCVPVEAPAANRRGESNLAAVVEAETHQSLEGYVLGSWPAGLQAGKLNVIAAPQLWSDQISGDVFTSGRNCRVIDSLPWALARAVGMVASTAAPSAVAALDWGFMRATLCLICDGAPAMVRCLKDCGFRDAIAAIERELHLPECDAEKLACQHRGKTGGEGVGASSVVDDALANALGRLEHELRRTLGYWQGQARGLRPETLYLLGGGASMAGIDRRLGDSLELDVQIWTLPYENDVDAVRMPPAHLLGPALAASALCWEAS
jgi:hypothetical protein